MLGQVGSVTEASAKAKNPVDPQAQSAAQTVVDAAISKLKKDNNLH